MKLNLLRSAISNKAIDLSAVFIVPIIYRFLGIVKFSFE